MSKVLFKSESEVFRRNHLLDKPSPIIELIQIP